MLVVDVPNDVVALAKVRAVLDGMDVIVKAAGFRDPSARLSYIFDTGCELWDRLRVGIRPRN
jgi:putative NADH-flavin reductase